MGGLKAGEPGSTSGGEGEEGEDDTREEIMVRESNGKTGARGWRR